MIFIGIDPDTKSTAVAIATKHKLLAVAMIRPEKTSPEDTPAVAMARALWHQLPNICRSFPLSGVVIEGQQIKHGSNAPPADILQLALVAGACLGVVGGLCVPLLVPTPHEWKGNTPKPINQMRTFRAFGLEAEQRSEYCAPLDSPALANVLGAKDVNPGDWKHLGDAAGLALWGARR